MSISEMEWFDSTCLLRSEGGPPPRSHTLRVASSLHFPFRIMGLNDFLPDDETIDGQPDKTDEEDSSRDTTPDSTDEIEGYGDEVEIPYEGEILSKNDPNYWKKKHLRFTARLQKRFGHVPDSIREQRPGVDKSQYRASCKCGVEGVTPPEDSEYAMWRYKLCVNEDCDTVAFLVNKFNFIAPDGTCQVEKYPLDHPGNEFLAWAEAEP